MQDATFELHKWHSNEPQLEDDPPHSSDEEHSYVKRQLQVQPNESKLLGVKWNKDEDTIAVQFPTRLGHQPQSNEMRSLSDFSKSVRPPWPRVTHNSSREANLL